MRFLVAEDIFMIRRLLEQILFSFGSFDVATNGLEAFQKFSHAFLQNDPYTVVFLDIVMPVMDGQTVLRQIRNFEDEKGVPQSKRTKIIMATAVRGIEDVELAVKSGCDGYIVKPFTREKIVNELRRLGFKLEQ